MTISKMYGTAVKKNNFYFPGEIVQKMSSDEKKLKNFMTEWKFRFDSRVC